MLYINVDIEIQLQVQRLAFKSITTSIKCFDRTIRTRGTHYEVYRLH